MLADTAYGKSRIRLVQVTRRGDRHELRDLTVAVRFEGDYDESYTAGDNSDVLPTDTMKNTVYALAAREPVERARERSACAWPALSRPQPEAGARARRPRRARLGPHSRGGREHGQRSSAGPGRSAPRRSGRPIVKR